MVYREVESDLFKVNKTYYLAHCISADFAMAAGIVVEFNKEFDMKRFVDTDIDILVCVKK